ncbi:hypothetical protein ACHAWF_006431, partial [Thalassiosira exigua]
MIKREGTPSDGDGFDASSYTCYVQTKDYDGSRDDLLRGAEPVARSKGRRDPKRFDRSEIDRSMAKVLETGVEGSVDALTWTTKTRRRGTYAGSVDRKMRPHGRGRWVPSDRRNRRGVDELSGWWFEGSFIPYDYLETKFNPDPREVAEQPTRGCRRPKMFRRERKGRRNKVQPVQDEAAQPPFRSQRHQRSTRDPAYKVGDSIRSRGDIVDPTTDGGRVHLRATSRLAPGDGAFVKRTDRTFTYAVLDERREDGTLVFRM